MPNWAIRLSDLSLPELQGFMTTGCPLDKELCSEQKVTIDCSEIMDIRYKEHVIQAALGLRDLQFGFRYIRDELGNVNRVWGVLVTTVEDIRDTSFIRLTINRDIFPVLTCYVESVGGTFLLKGPALETKGRLHFAASKCRYYGGLVRSGEMDRAHAVNIVRKIMLEDFSIDLP